MIVKVAVEEDFFLFVLGNVVYPNVKFINVFVSGNCVKIAAVAGIADHAAGVHAVYGGTGIYRIKICVGGGEIVSRVADNCGIKLIHTPGLEVYVFFCIFRRGFHGGDKIVDPLGVVSAVVRAAPVQETGDVGIIKVFSDD